MLEINTISISRVHTKVRPSIGKNAFLTQTKPGISCYVFFST